MSRTVVALSLASLGFLAACGGGGGGGGTGSTPINSAPPQVAITEANAKPVAANAMDSAQNLSAAQSGSLVTGVEVQADGGAGYAFALSDAARVLGARAAARIPALATAATIDTTEPCTFGGTARLTGTVANPNVLSAGDTITVSATNCVENVGGVTSTMNGSMTIGIASGTIGSTLPLHVVMNLTLNNLTIASGGVTTAGTGDIRLDLTVNSSVSESMVASGTSLSNSVTSAGVTRTTTLKNYSQTVTLNGTTATSALSATVQSNSTRLGTTGGSYTVTTTTPVVWNTATHAVTAGAIKVVGASGSQLIATVGASNTVTIQLDANGDNTYEKSITSSIAELGGLL